MDLRTSWLFGRKSQYFVLTERLVGFVKWGTRYRRPGMKSDEMSERTFY